MWSINVHKQNHISVLRLLKCTRLCSNIVFRQKICKDLAFYPNLGKVITCRNLILNTFNQYHNIHFLIIYIFSIVLSASQSFSSLRSSFSIKDSLVYRAQWESAWPNLDLPNIEAGHVPYCYFCQVIAVQKIPILKVEIFFSWIFIFQNS